MKFSTSIITYFALQTFTYSAAAKLRTKQRLLTIVDANTTVPCYDLEGVEFDAGYGGCETYALGTTNSNWCDKDKDSTTQVLAEEACSECGKCTDTTDDDTTDADFVVDVPDMSDEDIKKVMEWITAEATMVKNPFCWKDTYGRGVGTIPGRVADCPASYTNNGLTCGRGSDDIWAGSKVADCPSGYTNMG